MLSILNVIDVDPAEFFAELFGDPAAERSLGLAYSRFNSVDSKVSAADFSKLRGTVHGLLDLLVERELIDAEALDNQIR